jgi:hypothetical protein
LHFAVQTANLKVRTELPIFSRSAEMEKDLLTRPMTNSRFKIQKAGIPENLAERRETAILYSMEPQSRNQKPPTQRPQRESPQRPRRTRNRPFFLLCALCEPFSVPSVFCCSGPPRIPRNLRGATTSWELVLQGNLNSTARVKIW